MGESPRPLKHHPRQNIQSRHTDSTKLWFMYRIIKDRTLEHLSKVKKRSHYLPDCDRIDLTVHLEKTKTLLHLHKTLALQVNLVQ